LENVVVQKTSIKFRIQQRSTKQGMAVSNATKLNFALVQKHEIAKLLCLCFEPNFDRLAANDQQQNLTCNDRRTAENTSHRNIDWKHNETN